MKPAVVIALIAFLSLTLSGCKSDSDLDATISKKEQHMKQQDKDDDQNDENDQD